MVMKLYPEFEPAIQFAKTVGETEYAKLMELYTAWKSGAFSNTHYGHQSWDVDTSSWPSELKDGDMFLGEVTGITYVYVASTNTFYPVSNGGYRGKYSAYEKYIVGQLVTDADGNLYACVGANIDLQEGSDITGYSVGCALDNATYWALLSSGSNGGGGGAIAVDASRNYKGSLSELSVTVGTDNIAFGFSALQADVNGSNNIALGYKALQNNIDGSNNTAVGGYAGAYNLGKYNTHLGFQAGNGYSSATYNYSYNTAIGAYSLCTGSNQVQLGGSGTTTYVYGTVQNRSDIRDKTDVVDTSLGIAFITGLRAVEGVWDHRDDYYTESEVVDADGNVAIVRTPAAKDGSKKRNRKHQWFIAQEVKELCDRLGVDFGGYQDHSISGGADVLSLGYDEFIPPTVKAIQECWQRLDKLEERISKLEQ